LLIIDKAVGLAPLLLCAVHPHSGSEGLLELLLHGLASASAKYQLAAQLVSKRNVPVLRRLLIDDGVVVLQVSAEALGLERDPESILVHCVGLIGPVTEVVCVCRKLLAKFLDGLRVFIEKYLSRVSICRRELAGYRWLRLHAVRKLLSAHQTEDDADVRLTVP
jgi:hypothetical protein